MNRTCWARKMVYLINASNIERFNNIVVDELEVFVILKIYDILFTAGEQIVNTNNLISIIKKVFAQVTADKSCATSNKDCLHNCTWYNFPLINMTVNIF